MSATTTMPRENLISFLYLALRALEQRDAQYGPDFKSGGRAGLEDILADLRAGKDLEITE